MTELVAVQDQKVEIATVLMSDNMMKQLGMACAKTITPERLARVAMTELRTNDKLSQAAHSNPASFYGALMELAQIGLEPGRALGLAYLIPRRGVVEYEIGYKGLVALMYRSNMVSDIQAEVVYEGDYFEYHYGTSPELKHKPLENRDASALATHAYCVINTTTGGSIFRVMTFDEIEKIRKTYSKASRSDAPWVTAWSEQACKTVLKRTSKRAPISAEAQKAITLDDMSAVGLAQNLGTTITIETPEADIEPGTEQDPNEEEPPPQLCSTCGDYSIDCNGSKDSGFTLGCPNGHQWLA